jgi:hypothetical protein
LHAPGGYDADAVRWDSFEQYSAASMTRRLATVLDRAISSGPSAPAQRARELVAVE